MKYIFCDIDGVLNSRKGTIANDGISSIEEDKVLLLKELIDSLNAKVIINSRCGSFLGKSFYEDRISAIEGYGIEVYDVIYGNSFSNITKGQDYTNYLKIKNIKIDDVIIFDDNDDGIKDRFKNRFIKINPINGLTKWAINKARKL